MSTNRLRFLKVNSITELTTPVPNAVVFERLSSQRMRIYVTDQAGVPHISGNDITLEEIQAFVDERLAENQPVVHQQIFPSAHWVIPHSFAYNPAVVTTNAGDVISGQITYEPFVVHVRWWEAISGEATLQ